MRSGKGRASREKCKFRLVINHGMRNWAKRATRHPSVGYVARGVTLTLKKNECGKEHHWFTKRARQYEAHSGTCCSLYRNALAVKGLRDDRPCPFESRLARKAAVYFEGIQHLLLIYIPLQYKLEEDYIARIIRDVGTWRRWSRFHSSLMRGFTFSIRIMVRGFARGKKERNKAFPSNDFNYVLPLVFFILLEFRRRKK